MAVDPRERLRALLLERPEYAVTYHDDAEFHALVEGIIATVPALLRNAYDVADGNRQRRLAKTQAMKSLNWIGAGDASLSSLRDAY